MGKPPQVSAPQLSSVTGKTDSTESPLPPSSTQGLEDAQQRAKMPGLALKTNGHRRRVTLDCNFRTDQFPKRVMTGTFLLAK
jgi:hypothetical protein